MMDWGCVVYLLKAVCFSVRDWSEKPAMKRSGMRTWNEKPDPPLGGHAQMSYKLKVKR